MESQEGSNQSRPINILFAEDDEDDYLLLRDALTEVGLGKHLHWVRDGEELMEYLHHTGAYQGSSNSPRPALILLDLNMPRKDGRAALKEIKSDPVLRRIPVIALTTSKSPDDLVHTYDLGVNSLIWKPLSYPGFVDIAKQLKKYWFDIVKLPHHVDGDTSP